MKRKNHSPSGQARGVASRPWRTTNTERERGRGNNGLEQYRLCIATVGTHVKLCLRNNVHAKRQLAAGLRLLMEVPNGILRWDMFLRSEYIPSPGNVVPVLRERAYKYHNYAGLCLFRANCINCSKRSDRSV